MSLGEVAVFSESINSGENAGSGNPEPLNGHDKGDHAKKSHSSKDKEKKHKDKKHHKEKKKSKDKDREHKHRHKEHKHKHKDKHRSKDRPSGSSSKPNALPVNGIKAEPGAESAGVFSETIVDSSTPLSPKRAAAVKSEPMSPKATKRQRSIESAKPAASDSTKKVKTEVKEEVKDRKRKLSDTKGTPPSKVKKPASSSSAKAKKKPASSAKGSPKKELGRSDKAKAKLEIKREEEKKDVWRWWEEERKDDGIKWTTLEHRGIIFAPEYEPLPNNVPFKYDGKVMKLSADTEEVAGFYARMIEHDYTTKEVFNKNFMKDWRKVMTLKEKEHITDLKKCDFRAINTYYKKVSEDKKAMSKEEKLKIKEKNEALVQEYGYCMIDGHREKIGNFRAEPPGLFRGRGDHPKQGMLKRRINPEDVIINCSKGSKVPPPPAGHKWKRVQYDNKVSWLASWTENIQNQTKYVMLNASSRLKGEKDWQKYELARRLHQHVDKIRANYQEDLRSKEMRARQRAVAMYFIDKLALRAGNEKDSDEQADTVGCCSLRVEHITLHDKDGDKEFVVEFDFLGKDSIRYNNKVAVDKRVFKNVRLFMDNKQKGDDLFDRLNTAILNKHLQDLMEGLTAKVFRTYNASRTLEEQLNLLTKEDDQETGKMLAYNRANRAVAVLCNHQRAAPKTFDQQMERLGDKIKVKKGQIKEAKRQLKDLKADRNASDTRKRNYELKKKAVDRLEEQLHKLEVQATDKEENKEIALSTSKLNYLDPRISVAWCKKHDVNVEKVYNKTQRQKFMWAIDMAGADYSFMDDEA